MAGMAPKKNGNDKGKAEAKAETPRQEAARIVSISAAGIQSRMASLAASLSKDTEAHVVIVLDNIDSSKRYALDVLSDLKSDYPPDENGYSKLDDFPIVGSKHTAETPCNNPDKYDYTVTNSEGTAITKEGDSYTDFALSTHEGKALSSRIQQIAWMQNADTQGKVTDQDVKSMSAADLIGAKKTANDRLKSLALVYRKALRFWQQMRRVREMATNADGKPAIRVEVSKNAKSTWPLTVRDNTDAPASWERSLPFSCEAFMRLRPDAAVVAAGDDRAKLYSCLIASIARKKREGGKGQGKVTPTINMDDVKLPQVVAFFQAIATWLDRDEKGKRQAQVIKACQEDKHMLLTVGRACMSTDELWNIIRADFLKAEKEEKAAAAAEAAAKSAEAQADAA